MQFITPTKLCFYSFGENKKLNHRVFIIQMKAIRNIHVKGKFDHTSSLFSESNIIRLLDKISVENCLFVSKSLKNQLPEIFSNWFIFSSVTHRYETSCSEKGMLKVKYCNTKSHAKEAVIYSAINTWNNLQKQLKDFLLCHLSTFQLKFFFKYHYLKTYQH